MAAELGYMGIVKVLLKVCADVNKAVLMAARFGHADATRTTAVHVSKTLEMWCGIVVGLLWYGVLCQTHFVLTSSSFYLLTIVWGAYGCPYYGLIHRAHRFHASACQGRLACVRVLAEVWPTNPLAWRMFLMGGGAANELQDYLASPANRVATRNYILAAAVQQAIHDEGEIWKYLHKPRKVDLLQVDAMGRTALRKSREQHSILLQESISVPDLSTVIHLLETVMEEDGVLGPLI